MDKENIGKNIFMILLLFSIIIFSGCKNNKPEEIITIGVGLSVNPLEPRMALEVLTGSKRFFFYISNPEKDTCHYYTGSLNINEIEYVKGYLLKGLTLLDTLGYKEIDDATKIEVFHSTGNGVQKHGFGHLGDIILEDSVNNIVNILKKSPNFKCGIFHKFKTSIQYESLPIPPPFE